MPTLYLKSFILIDSDGQHLFSDESRNANITSYVTTKMFREAILESDLPESFVHSFMKDSYNGRTRFVTHYRTELERNYRAKADYIHYMSAAFSAIKDRGYADESHLAAMDTFNAHMTQQFLILIGAQVQAKYLMLQYAKAFPGRQMQVKFAEPDKIAVYKKVQFLHPRPTKDKFTKQGGLF